MPTKNRLVFVFIGLICFSARALGPGDVGNHGDAIECAASAESPFDGLYSLDYVLTYKTANQNADVVQIESLDASLSRISNLFKEKLPELFDPFDDFRQTIRNVNDYSRTRVWEERPFTERTLSDGHVVDRIPDNCKQGTTATVVQAVVREWPEFSGRPQNNIIYGYIPKVFDQLLDQSPLQLSFLIVHEWLWDISMNVERNQRLNRFFHSNNLENLTREELLAQLRGMGLIVPRQLPEVFREDVCPLESDGGAYWNDRFALSSGVIQFGEFKLHSRSRSCDSTNGCDSIWSETNPGSSSPASSNVVGEKTLITIKAKNEFEIISNLNSFTKHADCTFNDQGKVNCSVFLDSQRQPFMYQRRIAGGSDSHINFTGVLGRGCLKLGDVFWYSGESVGAVNGNFRQDEQLVLFAKPRI